MTIRLPLGGALFVLAILAAHADGADATQYVVRVTVKQGSPDKVSQIQILAAPILATDAEREVSFFSGNELTLNGKAVDKVGTEFTLRVRSIREDRIRVRGKLNVTKAIVPLPGVTGTTGLRVHVDRSMILGRQEIIDIASDGQSAIWMELQVDDARVIRQ